MKSRYATKEELLEKAKEAQGKKFKDLDKTGLLSNSKNKGGLGQIIEEGLFGMPINNRAEPDFAWLGVELKVTPVKLVDNGKRYSAKERLVLCVINYHEEGHNDCFKNSAAWAKAENMLIVVYLWEKGKDKGEYVILKAFLHEFSEEDLLVIEKDWKKIHDKIASGHAEDLTEADTDILAACTKGANGMVFVEQFGSDVKAKPRAFCLKTAYMSMILRLQLGHPQELLRIFSAQELREYGSYSDILRKRLEPFVNLRVDEIVEMLGFDYNPNKKDVLAQLTASMLGVKGMDLSKTLEFQQSNIHVKTIRLEPNGVPREHMSFGKVDFNALMSDSWEESQFFREFEENKYLLIVYQYLETAKQNPNRVPVFRGARLWNMPGMVINRYVKQLWKETRAVLKEGVKLERKGNRVLNNLPGAKQNPVCHLRSKAKDGNDKDRLPDGQEITKQAFWLNNTYVAKIVSQEEDESRLVMDVVSADK